MVTVDAPTLLFRTLGDRLAILVHGPTLPSDDDWMQYVRALETYGRGVPRVNLLVVTDDVGPSNAQRVALHHSAPKGVRTAVITTSVVARSIVTLLGWFDPNIRAFASATIDGALDYLGVLHDDRAGVLAKVATLRARLSGLDVESDDAASALLDQLGVGAMEAILARLPQLRSDVMARRRI